MGRAFSTSIGVLLALIVANFGVQVLGEEAPPAEPQFKAEQAKKAVELEKAAETKAKADYDKAVIAAKKNLIEALEPLMDRATRAGDLDEALKIRDKIALLKAEIAAMTEPKQSVAGEWNIVSSNGWHGIMQLKADGSALQGSNMKGQWSIEKGALVIKWSDGKIIDTYTAGTIDSMTGKSSLKNQTLTASRIKK